MQSVVAEDAPIPSVVCLDGTTRPLPISEDYAHFVKRGTGVVERLTGHQAYRLDVAAEITGGLSWQLGFFTAHVLAVAGELAQRGEVATHTLFITGQVDGQYGVRPVQHVAEKIRTATEALRTAEQSQIWTPTENAPTVSAIGLPVEAVAHAADVYRLLGYEVPEALGPAPTTQADIAQEPNKPSRVWPVVLSLVFLCGVAGAAFIARDQIPAPEIAELSPPAVEGAPEPEPELQPEPEPQPETVPEPQPTPEPEPELDLTVDPELDPVLPPLPRPDVPDTAVAAVQPPAVIEPTLTAEIWERRAPRGTSCVDVRFETAEAVELAVPRFNAIFGASEMENLCGLRFLVESSRTGRHVFAFLNVSPRDAPYLIAPWRDVNNRAEDPGVVSWESVFPPRELPAVSYQIVGLEAQQRLSPPQLLVVRNLIRAGIDPNEGRFRDRMADMGIAVSVFSHQLN